MPCRKPLLSEVSQELPDIEDSIPNFIEEEIVHIRVDLLKWYDVHQRKLPWRQIHAGLLNSSYRSHEEIQQNRAYATWVSEMMLQQTQVAVAIDYFNRWMEKWPTVKDLASATEEEVNNMWAGLGYYRRARFLLQGAKKVIESEGGLVPSSVEDLQKIPGIGKYTAGAIASIAFDQVAPLVDGNVIRVLSRLKAIKDNPKEANTLKTLWSLAEQLVDKDRPGDFNQALMELGATICSPASPDCSNCPIKKNCQAYALSIESKGSSNRVQVTDFPIKVAKASPRQEHVAVCVLERTRISESDSTQRQYLLVKRPKNGLLAGLWEFPSASLDGPDLPMKKQRAAIDSYLKSIGINLIGSVCDVERKTLGNFVHIFSHIRMHIYVEWMNIEVQNYDEVKVADNLEPKGIEARWVDTDELADIGLSSSVKKVYKMLLKYKQEQGFTKSGQKRKRGLQDYFTKNK